MITCGVCLGFLPHNFNPAKVFMGDAGALFLGLLMAAATMEIGGRTEGVTGQTYFFYAPLFLPLFILGVPIADMAFAYIRRAVKGTADRHARTTTTCTTGSCGSATGRAGRSLILWTWTAALSGFVLFPLFAPESNAIIPFAAIVLGLAALHAVPPRPATRSPQAAPPSRQRRRRGSRVAAAEAGIAAEIRLAAESRQRHRGGQTGRSGDRTSGPQPDGTDQGRRPPSAEAQKSRSDSSGTVRSDRSRASSQRCRSTRRVGSTTAPGPKLGRRLLEARPGSDRDSGQDRRRRASSPR